MRLVALIICAAALATAAQAATRSFPVGSFDRVQSSVPFPVRVHVGGAPSVVADGSPRLLDALNIRAEGGRLVIGMRPGAWRWDRRETLTVAVVAPRLGEIGLSGPGNVDVDRVRAPAFDARLSGPGTLRIGALDAARLTLNLSGPGDMIVAGRAGQARFTLSGPGNIRASRLGVQDLDVALSGPGDIDATVSGTAGGSVSGPGDLRIGGRARCRIARSGPGSVRCG